MILRIKWSKEKKSQRMNVILCLLLCLVCLSTCSLEPSFINNDLHLAHPQQLVRVKRGGGRGGGGRGRQRSQGNQMNPLTLLLGAKVIGLKVLLLKTLMQRTTTPMPMMVNGTMMGMGRRK